MAESDKAVWLIELIKASNFAEYEIAMDRINAIGMRPQYEEFVKHVKEMHRLYKESAKDVDLELCSAMLEYFVTTICTSNPAEAFPPERLTAEGEATYLRCFQKQTPYGDTVVNTKICGGPKGRQGIGIRTFKTLFMTSLRKDLEANERIYEEAYQVVGRAITQFEQMNPQTFNKIVTSFNLEIKQGVQDVYENMRDGGMIDLDGKAFRQIRIADTSSRGIPNLYLKRYYVKLFDDLYPQVSKCLAF